MSALGRLQTQLTVRPRPRLFKNTKRHRRLYSFQRHRRTEKHRLLSRDRLEQRGRSKDLQDSFHVVRQNVQAHLRTHSRQRFRQEVCCSHPCFQGTKGVFDSSLADPRCRWRLLKPLLHFLQHSFVFPPRDPTIGASRAFRFQRALRTCRRPVLVERHAVFHGAEAPDRALASWTLVLVIALDIVEVSFVEETWRLVAGS
jgi:hypothetical protein